MADKLDMKSKDMNIENLEMIRLLFPCAITEVQENGVNKEVIDFDVLRQELSDYIVNDKQERYQMTWPDKSKAKILANSQITGTLRPYVNESVNFENTSNIYIEGDNLDVLKLLRETYLGKVKMIYIDPPYNTGTDFVYEDNFAITSDSYINNSGQIDERGNRLVQNPENSGRFHTDWLNMMYPRLKVARDLLSDEGVIFISIDDHEVDNLKKICTEIFGQSNFLGCAGRITKKSNNKGDFWAPNFDYLITFAKNRDCCVPFTGGANEASYNLIEEEGPRKGERYQLVRLYMSSLKNRNPEQRFWIDCPDGSKIIPPGTTFPPERPNLGDGIWRWSRSTFEANRDKIVIKRVSSSNLLNEKFEPAQWNVFTKTYLNDVLANSSAKPNNFIEEHINQIASHELNALDIPFDYAKPTTLMKYLMEIAQIQDGDIVLDFFSGSASTADAVMQYNRDNGKKVKFIMVQLDEKIDEKQKAYKFLEELGRNPIITELGKERIRRAGSKLKENNDLITKDIDVGFRVLKLDSSNMQDVYYNPSLMTQSLLDMTVDNIKADRTPLDLLFQVMLDLGIELSAKIEEKQVNGKTYYLVNDNDIIACFDDNIDNDVITAIAKMQPLYAVFKDKSFATDSVGINNEQLFKTYSPATVIKVI